MHRLDRDSNGISIPSGGVSLDGGAVNVLSGGAAAILDHGGLATDPGHKVNGYHRG